jgi:hypothetical protein
MSRIRRTLVSVAAAAVIVAACAVPAYAAGTPYGGGGTVGGTGGTGGGTILTTCTVVPTQVTVCTARIGSDTVTITVPANTFTTPDQIVITDRTLQIQPLGPGTTVVLAFGVSFFFQGAKVTGTFSPVSGSVTGPDIVTGLSIYFAALTSNVFSVQPSTFTNGALNFTITSDPAIEVASTNASTASSVSAKPIAGGTVPVTGKPFGLEGSIAAVLVVGGSLLLVRMRRRRRTT